MWRTLGSITSLLRLNKSGTGTCGTTGVPGCGSVATGVGRPVLPAKVNRPSKARTTNRYTRPSTPPSGGGPGWNPPKTQCRGYRAAVVTAAGRAGGNARTARCGSARVRARRRWPRRHRAHQRRLLAGIAVAREQLRKLARRGRTVGRRFVERLQHDRLKLRRDARVVHARRRRLGANVLHRHGDRAVAAER